MQKTSNAVLEKFVIESNSIGSIPSRRRLYHDVHLRAAKAVRDNPKEFLFNLKALHRRFSPVFNYTIVPGEYRFEPASVGLQQLPGPQHILTLIVEFDTMVVRLCREDVIASLSPSEREAVAWEMHHRFVCIHPFADGNGRIARLLFNAVRLTFGLPWHIVEARVMYPYFQSIKTYEKDVFIPAHTWAYTVT